MLAALALLRIQAPEVPPIQWECARDIRQEGGLLTVVRQLDADGRFVADHLRWRVFVVAGQLSWVEWGLSGSAPAAVRGWSMSSDFSLSRAPSGRMWAIVRADGRELSRSPASLHPLRAWDRQGRPRVTLDYGLGRSTGAFGQPRTAMPALEEARGVEILIEEEGGAELARVRLAMPDWALIRSVIGRVRDVLGEDAAAYRARCRDITIPVRVQIRREVQPPR
jgi:hypothetical protein